MSTKIKLIHPKPLLTIPFYTEYQKRILNNYKFSNAIIPITVFYEKTSALPFLRFEDFSFDSSKNLQNTGKLYSIEGTLAHYSTTDSFEKLSNVSEVMAKASESKSSFILFIYGDLKTFLFRYRFEWLNTNINYKIKEIKLTLDESQTKEIENYKKGNEKIVTEKSWINIKDTDYVYVNDISAEPNSIPDFMKYAFCEYYQKTDKVNKIILDKSLNNSNHYRVFVLENIELNKNGVDHTKFVEHEILKVDMKEMFNPESIAENAVDLNINLMKWRMCPDLNTEIFKNAKYLLIGAGTLGCHVSRCLLGWGARHITFMDNGKVSYSNPVRQSLYTFEDSKNVNYKATLAAQKLKEVFPMADSRGINMTIPLPGRTIMDDVAKENYFKSLTTLEEEIKAADIIFLLTDSRESRWYPTLIAKSLNKTVVTAAIGFDSFLVMRHGTKINKLGCYFCSDISSPIDTSGNRTLDQQCTISRPGVSMMCSGLAIELAMSTMNAALNEGCNVSDIPHQLRGSLFNYSMITLRNGENKNCVACSDRVVGEYEKNREEFAMNVMNDPYFLEKISGVQELINDVKMNEELNKDEDDF